MGPFRATFIVLCLWLVILRTYYRIQGRGKVQERVRELWTMLAVIFFGLPFTLSVWLYIFHPQRLRSTNFSLAPAWRWAGAVIFAASLVLMTWVHVSLGKNFSATLRIRSDQELVTWGPYHYVRHPMYSAMFALVIGMGLLSANRMILAAGPIVVTVIMCLRTSAEEGMLLRAFGERYRQYAAVTGRFLPHVRGRLTQNMGTRS